MSSRTSPTRQTLLAGTLLAVAGFAQPAQAAEINLKLSHFLPPVHGIHTDFIEPWAKDLEECCGRKGRTSRSSPAARSSATSRSQQEQVLAGVVDIAHGLHGIPRGRFHRTSIIDLPFLTESAGAATQTLWDLFPEYLEEEYKGMKVLALHAHNGGLIHTAEKPVETMEDLQGLRIRTPSPAISMMLESLGAVPQGLPPGQVYESLQRGVIDGTVFPWDPVNSFRLAEVLNHHLDARAYTVSFFFVMNQDRFDELPTDVQACIDKLSGDALVASFGEWWDAWDAPGREAAEARGNEIRVLSDEERERWREALQPMIEAYLDQLESEGVDNAREIYEAMKTKIAELEG